VCKNVLKILNRLGKMSETAVGDFFWLTLYVLASSNHVVSDDLEWV